MSFNIHNKLIFIGNFQFTSFSLDSLVKSFSKDDFKNLRQEFDSKVLDLAKQKDFILMIIWMILKSPIKNCLTKKSFKFLRQVKK